MTLADDLRAIAHEVRSIPGDLGIRPYTVSVVVTTSAGDEFGEGTQTPTTTAITEANGQPPKVRWLSGDEIAIGGYSNDTVEVGPITPDHPGGGNALSTIAPEPVGNNPTVRYVLTGPNHPSGANYRLRDVKHDRAFQYRLVLERAG
jgi:hypothetical protein